MPKPRKLRKDSSRITAGIVSVRQVSTTVLKFGHRCFHRIAQLPCPMDRLAVTNAISLSTRTCPRTIRAIVSHCTSPSESTRIAMRE